MNIKRIIKEHGWTIERLAAEMTNKNGQRGISQPSLSQIINGNPTLDKLQEIASILKISVAELVRDEKCDIAGFVKVNGSIHEVNSFDDIEKLLSLREE